MNEIKSQLSYVNVSCNRYSHCIDCKNRLVCFAAKHSIAIYDIEAYKVIKLLRGHKSQVNSVKWVEGGDNIVVSSSSDKTAIIWQLIDSKTYNIKYKLIGHKESVIIAHSIVLSDDKLLSVTSSTDRSILIWINQTSISQLAVSNFIFDVRICNYKDVFPDVVVVTAGANETINFYQFEQKTNQLKSLIALKGHEDWIRSIHIHNNNGSLMVASSSQDCFIRVHQIERTHKIQSDINQYCFSIQKQDQDYNYLVKLETVLAGHEGWVSEVRWHQSVGKPLQLLSASMDKTMILWQQPNQDSLDDLWLESVRVGEVGGNTLGFLGCASSPELGFILGYSFNGALHLWKYCDNQWKPEVVLSAHFDEVTDIAWEPEGEYLLSCSNDQTTRLHSIWNKTWQEIARPQIHGYDLKCIAFIDRLSFASGADEKVLRLFRATKCFANSLKKISDIDISSKLDDNDVAHSASVPTLGLSNCAVYETNQIDHDFKPTTLEVPPTEESLLQNTLWPEIQKLYGHGYELFSVCCNNSGTILASACKATKPEHANIILWDIKQARQITQLPSHQLTITQIRFSSNDQYILSVSRDRTWSLFELSGDNYSRVAFSDKKSSIHSRIIWDCAFTHDQLYFITVSRDKTAVFWNIDSTHYDNSSNLGPVKACDNPLTLSESITTVDILNVCINNNYLIVFGLENGNICLYYWNPETFWTHLLDIEEGHDLTVNRIRFSPKVRYDNDFVEFNMASAGADHSLKIFTLSIKIH